MQCYNLGHQFEYIVKSYPENSAIRFINGEKITYQDLDARVNQIANYFKRLGVVKKDVVAIFNHKMLNDLACMLACLKIGAIYTNLDPMNPPERLLKIMKICLPKYILYNSDGSSDKLNQICFNSHWIDCSADFLTEIENEDSRYLEIQNIHGDMAAYIMFTSGSTGFPKGAVMTHDNILRFIHWSRERFDITCNDVLANVNPMYFDNSVFDFYSALFTGASLAPIPTSMLKKPREVLKLINELRCTLWFSVPSFLIYLTNLKILNINEFSHVRKIIFGGEGFPKSKLKQLMEFLPSNITYTNVYSCIQNALVFALLMI